MIAASRKAFRAQKGINEDNYITFFAPGNTRKEIKFSFKVFQESMKKFANEASISSVNKEFFEIFIPVPKD